MKTKKYNASAVSTTTDLIELLILEELERLRIENKRYKSGIAKSGNSLEIKQLDTWKPFDFYSYFCIKYQEKYKKKYNPNGNLVRIYHRIEAFLSCNKISNENFKEFIDIIFKKYFNAVMVPIVGHICSDTLYNKMLGTRVKQTCPEDLLSLDQQIMSESKKFEDEIFENNDLLDIALKDLE